MTDWIRRHWTTWVLVPVLWAALFLRAHGLSRTSLWNDEGNTAITIESNFAWTVTQILDDAVHPPLYFLLEKMDAAVLGRTEFGLRWPAVAFGVLSVAALARLTRRWLGAGPASIAGLWLAVTPCAIAYSREARMYSLVLLLNIGVVYALSRWLTAQQRNAGPAGAAFGVASAALYLTHYFGLFLALVQFVFFLADFRRYHRVIARWAVAQALASIPIGVWIVLQYQHGVTLKINWIPVPTLASLWNTWLLFTGGGAGWPQAAAALGVSIVVITGWLTAPAAWRGLWLSWLALPAGTTFLISLRRPLYVDRYFIGSLAPLGLFVAVGLWSAARMNRSAALLGTAVLCSALAWQGFAFPDLHAEDWRGAMVYLQSQEETGDALLRRSKFYWAVDYYYRGLLPVESMDGAWRAALPAGRLWLVVLSNTANAGATRAQILDDVYSQSPDLQTRAWLESLEPQLQELRSYGTVEVLEYRTGTTR